MTEAKSRGLTRYFTGKPCIRGHIAFRNVSSKRCAGCAAEYYAIYYLRNRHRLCAKARAYGIANRQKIANKNPAYRQKNADALAKRKHTYAENNKAKVAAQQKLWYDNNKDRAMLRARRRKDRIRGAIGTYTHDEWEYIKTRQNNKCNGCGLSKKLTVDHIIPISRGGQNTADNIQGLCKNCNSEKHDSSMDEWLARKARLHAA